RRACAGRKGPRGCGPRRRREGRGPPQNAAGAPATREGTPATQAVPSAAASSASNGTPPSSPSPEAAPASVSSVVPPARIDNLVALEMGGRVENRMRYLTREQMPDKALDGNPKTVWMTTGSPPELVLSFLAHDSALVAGVTITNPPAGPDPIWSEPIDAMFPKTIEIWMSTDGPAAGFRKIAAADIPKEAGDHTVSWPAPIAARFVKIVFAANHGSFRTTVVGDVTVKEGQAAGYTPFLQRHADL